MDVGLKWKIRSLPCRNYEIAEIQTAGDDVSFMIRSFSVWQIYTILSFIFEPLNDKNVSGVKIFP